MESECDAPEVVTTPKLLKAEVVGTGRKKDNNSDLSAVTSQPSQEQMMLVPQAAPLPPNKGYMMKAFDFAQRYLKHNRQISTSKFNPVINN